MGYVPAARWCNQPEKPDLMPAPRAIKAKRKGPSSRITSEILGVIKRLAQRGFLPNEIADIIGVSRATMWRWRADERVAEALVIGHEAANARVELAIYQAAIGFEREEEELKVIKGKLTRVPVSRYYPPNVQAAAFWARHKMQWGEDMPPPPSSDDDAKPVEVRQVARQVARLLHIASKETQQ